jgi:hypothetical protein
MFQTTSQHVAECAPGQQRRCGYPQPLAR